jgi:hypothetical protein
LRREESKKETSGMDICRENSESYCKKELARITVEWR